MPVTPVARMLLELGGPAAPAATWCEEAAVSGRCRNCRSEDEARTEVEKARTRGFAEGWERGRSERIQSEQQLMDKLAEEQNVRLGALAELALSRMDAGLERVRTETSRALAQALVAFFQGRIELEATEALLAEIRHILAEQGAARVIIRGPQSWIDRLTALPQVAAGSGIVDVQASEAIDVTVNIDGTLLETTVGEWLTGLGRVL